jgi:hypothetical protein
MSDPNTATEAPSSGQGSVKCGVPSRMRAEKLVSRIGFVVPSKRGVAYTCANVGKMRATLSLLTERVPEKERRASWSLDRLRHRTGASGGSLSLDSGRQNFEQMGSSAIGRQCRQPIGHECLRYDAAGFAVEPKQQDTMKWININEDIFATAEVAGASNEAVGIWIKVLRYCTCRENGGCIVGAADWNSKIWQTTCGITAKEVRRAHPLVEIIGADVKVLHYPIAQENCVRAKREAGEKGGRPKGSGKNPPPADSHHENHLVIGTDNHPETVIGIEKEAEGESEREKESVCVGSAHTPHTRPHGASGGLQDFPTAEEAWSYAQQEGVKLTQEEVRYWHDTMCSKGWKTHDWRAELRRAARWIPGDLARFSSEPPISCMEKKTVLTPTLSCRICPTL